MTNKTIIQIDIDILENIIRRNLLHSLYWEGNTVKFMQQLIVDIKGAGASTEVKQDELQQELVKTNKILSRIANNLIIPDGKVFSYEDY